MKGKPEVIVSSVGFGTDKRPRVPRLVNVRAKPSGLAQARFVVEGFASLGLF